MKALYFIGLALLISACGGEDGQSGSEMNLNTIVELEEKIQQVNVVQLEMGNMNVLEVRGEMSSLRPNSENQLKIDKLNSVLNSMAKIDKISATMIEKIDRLKMELLESAGENASTVKDKSPDAIIWRQYDKKDPCRPTRMNMYAVKDRDNHEAVTKMFVDDSGVKPSTAGKNLWKDYIKFRSEIVSLAGTYEWGGREFSVNPKAINSYRDHQDLRSQVQKMLESNSINDRDDIYLLIELYMGLTKLENISIDGNQIHWMAYKFNNASLVGALAELTAMQQEILAARRLALSHWKGKVSTGEYSFNKIMPLAYGPSQANSGDQVEIMVMMAAFDSDNQPVITFDNADAKANYRGDGTGTVIFTAKKGLNTIKGTVSIKNKSGVKKTENWEYAIEVIE